MDNQDREDVKKLRQLSWMKFRPGYLLNLFPTEERISEFKKCIALCANCHREGHNGFINIR